MKTRGGVFGTKHPHLPRGQKGPHVAGDSAVCWPERGREGVRPQRLPRPPTAPSPVRAAATRARSPARPPGASVYLPVSGAAPAATQAGHAEARASAPREEGQGRRASAAGWLLRAPTPIDSP